MKVPGICHRGVGFGRDGEAPLTDKGLTSTSVSPDGKSLYVTSATANGVAVFSRDKRTGALAQPKGEVACVSENGTGGNCSNGVGLKGAQDVGVSPNGRAVYVASRVSDAVSIFARHPRTGHLTQLRAKAGCISEDGSGGRCRNGEGLNGASVVSIPPDGRSLYVGAVRGFAGSFPERGALSAFTARPKSGALRQAPRPKGCFSDIDASCVSSRALGGPSSVVVSPDGNTLYTASHFSIAIFDKQR